MDGAITCHLKPEIGALVVLRRNRRRFPDHWARSKLRDDAERKLEFAIEVETLRRLTCLTCELGEEDKDEAVEEERDHQRGWITEAQILEE